MQFPEAFSRVGVWLEWDWVRKEGLEVGVPEGQSQSPMAGYTELLLHAWNSPGTPRAAVLGTLTAS